ncbi:MAG: hypothetical protein ABR604_03905 [Jatrophihabitantaceae bacterium]
MGGELAENSRPFIAARHADSLDAVGATADGGGLEILIKAVRAGV